MMLLLNTIIGLILSSYDIFNWLVNDVVILLNTGFFIYMAISNIKDGYKPGLSFLFIIMAFLQYVSGLFIESTFYDNWLLIIMLATFFSQFGLVLVAKGLSRYS